MKKGLPLLPKVYISFPEMLPKPFHGKHIVSVNKLIRDFGSFSGVMLELKQIINHPKWNLAWLILICHGFGWYIIENIFWK